MGGLDEGIESAPEADTAHSTHDEHGARGITLGRPFRQLPHFFYPIAQAGPLLYFY
jgi:hypothetical protein